MTDPAQEFQELLILRQGLMDGLHFELPKISLRFYFPKRFDIQFNKAVDYRIKLPLSYSLSIQEWSASRDSEFLNTAIERWRRTVLPMKTDLSQVCHFHLTFHEGYLDVLAEDCVFMMISR